MSNSPTPDRNERRNSPLLWAEDDPNDILLGRRALEKAGITDLQIVRDGIEAIRYLSGEGPYRDRKAYPVPSVLLLDLKLPKVSGHEVLKWVKEQPGLRRIPVILFTSSEETADIDRAYDLGANAYLLKEIDFHELVSTFEVLRTFWFTLNRNPELEGQRRPVRIAQPASVEIEPVHQV